MAPYCMYIAYPFQQAPRCAIYYCPGGWQACDNEGVKMRYDLITALAGEGVNARLRRAECGLDTNGS